LKGERLQGRSDVAVFAYGPMVYESLLAAELLENEDISCAVIDCYTIKPLDVECVKRLAEKTGFIITVEEHQIAGGLGGNRRGARGRSAAAAC